MKKLLILSFASLLIGLTACKKSSPSSNTMMNVKISDGPGNYDAVVLNVKEINVITSGGTTTLPVGSRAFDILKFRNGRDTLIASQTIPSGTLKEVRLVLENTGNYVRIGGINYDLTTPSGQSSGVKLKVQEDLLDGVAYTLLLDFDAAKSIVQTGNGKYILKPVIRAIPNAVSGAITGMVSPIASSPKIYAITGVDTVGTIIDATGKFYFNGMPEGSYKINFETSLPYLNQTLPTVMVTKGTVTNVGTVSLQ
jgi:hypothetical protein